MIPVFYCLRRDDCVIHYVFAFYNAIFTVLRGVDRQYKHDLCPYFASTYCLKTNIMFKPQGVRILSASLPKCQFQGIKRTYIEHRARLSYTDTILTLTSVTSPESVASRSLAEPSSQP